MLCRKLSGGGSLNWCRSALLQTHKVIEDKHHEPVASMKNSLVLCIKPDIIIAAQVIGKQSKRGSSEIDINRRCIS